jgi:hypothetical protein
VGLAKQFGYVQLNQFSKSGLIFFPSRIPRKSVAVGFLLAIKSTIPARNAFLLTPPPSQPISHDHNTFALQGEFPKTRARFRYRDYLQRRMLRVSRPGSRSRDQGRHDVRPPFPSYPVSDLTLDRKRFLNNDWKDFKIPSVLYYHRDGKFCGAGDPAQWEDIENLHPVQW